MFVVVLSLAFISLLGGAFAAELPVEYAKNQTMRTLWGFANRRLQAEGWCKLSDMTSLIHKNPHHGKATDTEKRDVIRAMARKVRLETKEESLRAAREIGGRGGDSAELQTHFGALRSIYEVLIAKKYGEPAVHTKYTAMVKSALGKYDLSAAIEPAYARYALKPTECSAVDLTKPVATAEFKDYMAKRQVEGAKRYSQEWAEKAYLSLKAYHVGGYRLNNDIIAINTVRGAENWDWDQMPKVQISLNPGEKTAVIFDNKTTEDLIVLLSSDDPKKVAAVSYANALNIGGGVLAMKGTQEEDLVRHVLGLYYSLLTTGSHRADDGRDAYNEQLVYPDIGGAKTYKGSKVHAAHYTSGAFLALGDNPIPANIITVAASDLRPKSAKLSSASRSTDPKGIREDEKKLVRVMFRIALDHGHTTLITGLIGCGAFGHDAGQMGEVYAEVLAEAEFVDKFNAVIISTYLQKTQYFQKAFLRKSEEIGLSQKITTTMQ